MNWSEWLVNDDGSILIRIQLISRHFVALILYSLCTAGNYGFRDPAIPLQATDAPEQPSKKRHRILWGFLYVGIFIAVFTLSAAIKLVSNPLGDDFSVVWNDSVGTVYADIPYGDGDANKFDLYVPADRSRQHYGLVVYLHSGGFTSGDKADDARTLHWLCAQGYVAAGINYTLFSEQHPGANILTQSLEIKRAWTRWSPRRPSWATP